ncbi:MAG TPA: glycosyltransferase 87 family protein [Streptosporangiaceae bacterium]
MNTAIVLITVLAVGLRLYQLTRPQYLLGVTEYDDGTDFGSAILLIHGYLPYRDFIMVQPPGITLLMAPVAAATKALGTAWGMGVGRILTAVAGGAAAGLAGLLVRQRGLLAVILASGIVAVYPASVQAAHTVLLEPWLVLFCVLGALAVFDGDRLSGSGKRLVWGGLAFGFAGAIKVWAILPVLVILVLAARQPRRALGFAAGVAAGFLAAVLPFAALAPRTFYDSVVLAQLVRVDVVRVAMSYRLHQITGLTDFSSLGPVPLTIVTVAILVLIVGCAVAASRRSGQAPLPLEQFAYGATVLTIIAFLWPADFYYHYAGFLAPFLALAIALPVGRLVATLSPAAGATGWLARHGTAAASVIIVIFAIVQAGFETTLQPPLAPTTPGLTGTIIDQAQRVIPPGACVLADQASYAIAANRFGSSKPGCVPMVDGVGSDYSLSQGRNAASGAQHVPAVRALWLSALRGADYVWLSPLSYKRIPWTAREITVYFDQHFVPAPGGPFGLYVRKT